MGHLYQSILDTIGNTPAVKINNLGPGNVNIYVKIESFNPMGSVKDRLALGVIEDAERLLIRPIEQELRGLDGLKEMSATAYESGANLILEFEAGLDIDPILTDVREKVDIAGVVYFAPHRLVAGELQ